MAGASMDLDKHAAALPESMALLAQEPEYATLTTSGWRDGVVSAMGGVHAKHRAAIRTSPCLTLGCPKSRNISLGDTIVNYSQLFPNPNRTFEQPSVHVSFPDFAKIA
ncbi:hypothetical protein [Pelagibacterium halotolerans]|uniref:hypothetical protein n=1 Tax=Pelagibacterium halotolerans TaxID=531813 RepID=UPI0005A085FA|nr:hypothetical protein [Pelagibacterium halotolerans]QJR17606.1 hypothetical protein HKM20_03615 [Pelagibacterium halotolerans]